MSIRHKVIVNLMLESGCSQEDGEVERSWSPVNFQIYSDLFIDMINEAIEDWINNNPMRVNVIYEVTLAHQIESDGAGAVHSEYFTPVMIETQVL